MLRADWPMNEETIRFLMCVIFLRIFLHIVVRCQSQSRVHRRIQQLQAGQERSLHHLRIQPERHADYCGSPRAQECRR